MHHQLIYATVASCVALVGAVWDLRYRRIPNWLTYPAMVAGLVLHLVLDRWSGLAQSAGGLLIGGGLFLAFFLIRALGGGDVKLMAAVCAWVGSNLALPVVLACALAGGFMAIVLMIQHRRVSQTLKNVGSIISHHAHSGINPHPSLNIDNETTLRMPYGLAIAAGAAYALSTVLTR